MENNKTLDIAMLSCIFTDNLENYVRNNTKSAFQNAANSFQKAIINGLKHNNANHVRLINAMPVGTFPKYSKLPLVKGVGYFGIDKECYDASFVNLPFLSNESKYNSIKKSIENWCHQDFQKPKVLIGYAMLDYVLKGLSLAKRINPKVITCLIVPDLPENMYQNKKSVLKTTWNWHMKNLYKESKNDIDCYALISKPCAEKLNLLKNYIVLEGIIDISLFKKTEKNSNKQNINKVFLYTGGLYEQYGVKNMVEEFLKCNQKNISLHIYGDGPLKKYIIDTSCKDNRVLYKGMVSREECIYHEQEAFGLINPRKRSSITPYSFPSKIMEYLASGTPTLCYEIEGIPKEYYDYLCIIKDEHEGLTKAIDKFCEMDEETYFSLGKKAKDFVFQTKSESSQTNRLLELIRECINESRK